jgi:hypothetical protein
MPLSSSALYRGGTPQTQYAEEFIEKCEKQQWFMDEIERLLNTEQKSINTLQSGADLRNIVALAYSNSATRLPPAVGELTELREIFMPNNKLTSIPKELFKLSKLQVIDFSHNAITGQIPEDFNATSFPALKVLLLWDNQLTGAIPGDLYTLTGLENLDLSYNKLEGAISATVGGLTKLKIFEASNNQLTGAIPPEFGNCAALKALILWNNKLTGAIPDVFGALPAFEVLDVAINDLSGNLPQNLPNSLRKFAARNNQLSGAIPDYGSLAKLDTLDLYHNALTGGIPQTLGALTKMERLDLGSNLLRGTVPDIFSGMADLSFANLSGNKLAGKPPQSLADRQTGGAAVNIAKNYLTGETAKAIKTNNDNFIDGAGSQQNRMYLSEYVQINEGQERNIYTLFAHRDARTSVQPDKAKLPADGYVLKLNMTQAEIDALLSHYQVSSIGELVTFRYDADGWYITVHKTLETAHPVIFVLQILHNDGSDYSRTVFKVTSETPPAAGGIGGGGTGDDLTPTPTPEPDGAEPEPPDRARKVKFIGGYPDGTVRPDGTLTREEAARMLCNVTERSGAFPYNGEYSDVDTGRWSADDIAYLSRLGILTGYPDGTFRPTRNITRAEFVTILCRYQRIEPGSAEPGFPDAAGHWAAPYITAFSARGLITGYPDGRFGPDRPITRAEAAAVMCRLLEREPDRGALTQNPYTDLPAAHWAYWYVLEASYEYLPDGGKGQ